MNITLPTLDSLHDETLAAQVQQRLDQLTKPLGALGRLEALAPKTPKPQNPLQR